MSLSVTSSTGKRWLPGSQDLFGNVQILAEGSLDLSGPRPSTFFPFFFPGSLHGDILLTFKAAPDAPRVIWRPWLMAADGNTQKCDLWLGKTKSKHKRQRQPACPRRDEGSQAVSNPRTVAFTEQAENWPGLTGRAYWAPVAALTSCPLLASALNPAAAWTKRLWLWLNLKWQDSLERFRSRNQLYEEMCQNSERRAAMFGQIFWTLSVK